jgi:general secretion pathway protein N
LNLALSPLRRAAAAALFFLFTLIALLPLRLAIGWADLGRSGLAARAATGSIWSGALEDAQLGPVSLGDLRARLNILPLLLGRVRLSLASADPATNFSGAVVVTSDSRGFEDIRGRLRPGNAFGRLGVASLDLDGVSAHFGEGRCLDARGGVSAMLGGAAAAMAPGSGLTGQARCRGEAMEVNLANQPGTVRMDMRLAGGGGYAGRLLVRDVSPAARVQLIAAGFRPAESGLAMQFNGAF